MEIALAGEDLEDVIQKYGTQIDQEMIDILDERTKAARRQALYLQHLLIISSWGNVCTNLTYLQYNVIFS